MLNRQTAGRFHLVTHSMGGIVARAVFNTWKFNKLGRVVMLAPPHAGSHIARRLSPWFSWLTPSLAQLSDECNSFVNQLPNTLLTNQIEFGLVEARRDRVVPAGSVVIPGYDDYAIVDGHHGILPSYRRTGELVENFLVGGTFAATDASEARERPTSRLRCLWPADTADRPKRPTTLLDETQV